MKTYSVIFAIKPINGESKWECYAVYNSDFSITRIGKTPEKALEKATKELRKINVIS